MEECKLFKTLMGGVVKHKRKGKKKKRRSNRKSMNSGSRSIVINVNVTNGFLHDKVSDSDKEFYSSLSKWATS